MSIDIFTLNSDVKLEVTQPLSLKIKFKTIPFVLTFCRQTKDFHNRFGLFH